MMNELFGGTTATRTLLYLQNYGDGYAGAVARTFGMSRSQVTQQLKKFERIGILVSREIGRVRLYEWNPRNPSVPKLRELLQSMLELLPEEEIQAHYRERRRPRRTGKAA